MKHISLIILTIFAALNAAAETRDPIVIGWTGPLTGNCAVVGVDSAAAVQLVVDETNQAGGIHGRPLELVVEDDAYITTRAVTAFNKLAHHNRSKIIIANTYGGVFATAASAVRSGVLVIDPLDCNDDIAALAENTLCLATRTESISTAFASHIIGAKISSVLLLVEESDGWMQLIARNTRSMLEQAGVSVLEDSSPATTTSYKSSLLRAKKAEAAAVIILGNDQMGVAPREMRELGLGAQIYGIGSILSPGFQALAGSTLEGALVSSWLAQPTAAYHDFLRRFKQKNGRIPALELASLPSYDVSQLLVHCLREVLGESEDFTAAQLRECLLSQQDFNGLTGKISFDADGAVRSIHERLPILLYQ